MVEKAVPKKGFLSWYFDSNLLVRIIIALLAGAAVGIFLAGAPALAKTFIAYTKFFGDIFVRLLMMIVVPVIFFSLITGAGSIAPAQLGRVGAKTLIFYLVVMLIAISIGLILATVLEPGKGLNIVGAAGAAAVTRQPPPLSEVLLNIVPTNPFAALVNTQVLPIIFFSICFGIGLSIIRHSPNEQLEKGGNMLYSVISAAAETMYKVVAGIMQYAPVGVFVLIAIVFAQNGPRAVGPLLFVTLVAYAAFVLHVCIGFGAVLMVFGLSFFKFLKGVQEPMITAFVTRSSNATLPITMRVSEENLGIPRSVSAFTLPLGATINMDGTAIYLAICSIFIGFATNQPLGFDQKLSVFLLATLGAVGAAGVPGAGVIMLLMVLEGVGLKVEAGSAVAAAYAMIFGIDALLDMGRTCLNVTGDIVAAAVVSKTEGQLDLSKWA